MLPPHWVDAVSFFLAAKNHLVKSRLALCANLKYWSTKGLTLDDARQCFRRLMAPEVASRHVFETQLMADLAALVAECIQRRRTMEDQRRQASTAPTDRIVVSLAEMFRAGAN